MTDKVLCPMCVPSTVDLLTRFQNVEFGKREHRCYMCCALIRRQGEGSYFRVFGPRFVDLAFAAAYRLGGTEAAVTWTQENYPDRNDDNLEFAPMRAAAFKEPAGRRRVF